MQSSRRAVRNIYVYTDGGVGASHASVQLALEGLQIAAGTINRAGLHGQVSVSTTTADEICSGLLQKEASSILVMPGGRDLPFVAKLSGRGNQEITRFVREGGGYLGLCAGAYYGCSSVLFAQGDRELEVYGERELKLYPGTAIGPVFDGFSYYSNSGARAVEISYTAELSQQLKTSVTRSTVYYNGGCYMQAAELSEGSSAGHTVLAHYSHDPTLPAIVACRCGNGRAVLSGVHIEASTDTLVKAYSHDSLVSSLLPNITEEARQQLLVRIIEYLINYEY